MKQNPDFIITELGENHILVPVGATAMNVKVIVSMNDMGQTIWNMLEKDTTEEELLKAILEEYEVSEQKARADIHSYLEKLREVGCIEE